MDLLKNAEKPSVSLPEGRAENGNIERVAERIEKHEEKKVQPVEKIEAAAPAPQAAPAPVTDDYRLRREKQIDDILADGLEKIYLSMKPEDQKRFKQEGEKTASAINRLLDKTKAGMGKIISLIKRWLGLIPGANRYFLEQEAKIKADRIMKINKSI